MSEMLAKAAAQLELAYVRAPGSMWWAHADGVIDGHRVSAKHVNQGVLIQAWFEMPMDLGLSITSATFSTTTGFRDRIQLGDSDWDDELYATADEPSRAKALFESGLKPQVLALNALGARLTMNDATVSVVLPPPDVMGLVDVIRRTATVARDVDVVRRALPAAGPVVELAAAGSTFASQAAFEVTRCPFTMRGTLDGASVGVRCARWRSGFGFELHAMPLDPGPEYGLSITPSTLLDHVATLFGGEDVRVGDTRFDPAFRVRCADPELAKALLDEEAQALLFDVASVADELTLTDRSLLLRTPAARVPPDRLVSTLQAAAALTARATRPSLRGREGPYR